MFFRNVLDIFHISDFSIMVNHRNGNRFFINFRGHIYFHFEAKFPQNKVSWNIKMYLNEPHYKCILHYKWLSNSASFTCGYTIK